MDELNFQKKFTDAVKRLRQKLECMGPMSSMWGLCIESLEEAGLPFNTNEPMERNDLITSIYKINMIHELTSPVQVLEIQNASRKAWLYFQKHHALAVVGAEDHSG